VICSLLCTSTKATPHERFFTFDRRSANGTALPTWLMIPGKVFLRHFVRSNKDEPPVDEVDLLDTNPTYARIRYQDGRESTVSLMDLAPCRSLATESESATSRDETTTNILTSPKNPLKHRCICKSKRWPNPGKGECVVQLVVTKECLQ